MFYLIKKDKLTEINPDEVGFDGSAKYFGFIDSKDKAEVLNKLGFNEQFIIQCSGTRTMLFENFDGYDFMSLDLPVSGHKFSQEGKIYIFLKENIILFVLEGSLTAEQILLKLSDKNNFIGFDRILNNFFEKLISGDCEKIDKIEQEISDLENALLDSIRKNCTKEIAALRKKLLLLKRYYEQLLNILDELLENENEVLSDPSLRYLRVFENIVDRRYHTILNLRDYVTQVREAYQAEVDISLNNIMKIFTVITAVFLPLTLLVGWYGMNLKIPEYSWPYSYPMVIALSIAIVLFCIAFFKKKKWF